MELQLNKELIRKPVFWAILIPAVLMVWTIPAALNMARHSGIKKRALSNIRSVEDNAQRILRLLGVKGTDLGTDSTGSQNLFTGKASAMACACIAEIPESRWPRGEAARPKPQKNGSILHTETYKLLGVKFLQIALFIDHAERHFTNVTCDNLTLTYAPANIKDSWDANIHLEYIELQ